MSELEAIMREYGCRALLSALALAAIGLAPVVAGEAGGDLGTWDLAPPAVVVAAPAPAPTPPADRLGADEPGPVTDEAPIGPIELEDQDAVFDEVRALATADRYQAALTLLREYRTRHPESRDARRLELAVEVAWNEYRMRNLLADVSQERGLLLGDPDYMTAKAAADRTVVERLDRAEFLIAERRWTEAVDVLNAILADHPWEESTLTLKRSLLERMIDFNQTRYSADRDSRNQQSLSEVIREAAMPQEPKPVPRNVFIFAEDVAAMQRDRVQSQLRVRLDEFVYDEAPVGDVLRQLFALAGINFVILDEAISEQTLSLFVVDETVEQILATIQSLVDLTFNYRGGMVFVTNSESEVLETAIIRLRSGLTNVMMEAQVSAGGGGDGGSGGGGADASSVFGEAGSGQTDLERFLERLPELVPWTGDYTHYLERKSNTLYVRASPATIAEVKRLLAALDYSSDMVLITAKFIELSEEALRELGVNWKLGGFRTTGDNGVITGGIQSNGTAGGDIFSNLAVLANPQLAQAAAGGLEQALAVNSGGLAVGLLGSGSDMVPNFEAQLKALESKGKAHTLSEPQIITLSNGTGVFEISRDVVFVSDFENRSVNAGDSTTDNGTVITNTRNIIIPRFETEKATINLRVVPSVARNGEIITLAIFPTIREEDASQRASQAFLNPDTPSLTNTVEQPVFVERRLATALNVKNGQTVVLGGLINETKTKTRTGIPGLMDVPWVGRLFSTEKDEVRRTKLMIFVTARLIDPSGSEYSEELRLLRDTAKVVLPDDVRREIARQEAEADARAEAVAEEAAARRAAAAAEATPAEEETSLRERLRGE